MKWIICLWSCGALGAIPSGLRDFHELAQKRSETLAMADARTSQAEERKARARGSLLPTISARYTYQGVDATSAPRGPFTRLNQYSTLFNFTQPLYNGATYPAYTYSRIAVELQNRLREQEGLGLWSSVAEAYYALWMAQTDLVNARQLQLFSDERAQELRERVRVGRSRKGELLQAEAQLASVNAELMRTENAVAEAQERIYFLAGEKWSTAFPAIPDLPAVSPPLGEYLLKISQRPDIKARAQEVQLFDREVSVAKAGHHPTVNLTGNYYLERTGVLAESEWDVGVSVNLPLYQGGTVQAQTREAVEKKREGVLAYERLKREVERDVKILWQNSQTLEKIIQDLKLAFNRSESTYKENKKDYRYGLVTSLDVLVALNDFIDSKRSLERAQLEKELIQLQLKIATGEAP